MALKNAGVVTKVSSAEKLRIIWWSDLSSSSRQSRHSTKKDRIDIYNVTDSYNESGN